MSPGEIIFEVLKPSSATALLLALGLLLILFKRRTGIWLLGTGAAAFIGAGVLPIGPAALAPLEGRFPPGAIASPPDGIILLGGYTDWTAIGNDRYLPLGDSAERLTSAASLALRYPDARLIISGSPLPGGGSSSAALSSALLEQFGITRSRIVLDERSLSTWDNARFSLAAAKPLSGERYVLVTSAYHMPRAVGTFRAVGWPALIPWPVDYQVPEMGELHLSSNVPAGRLLTTDRAAREWLALGVYRTLGRTLSLFPMPQSP